MENLFVKLQKLSSTFLGLNFLNDTPKTKTTVFKSISFIAFLFVFIVFSLYDAIFDENIKFQEKLQIVFILLAAGGFLIIFISFWWNEDKFQLLTKWVQARHTHRSFQLINEISNVAYGALSTRMWKIGK